MQFADAMTLRMRARALGGALALVTTLGACSSTTDGMQNGGPLGSTTTGTSSSPGSPSTPSTTSTSASTSGGGSGSPAGTVTVTAPQSNPAPRSSSSAPAADVHPAPSSPLRTVTTEGDGDGSGVYTVKVWQERKDDSCRGHAYGQPVINFLAQHDCDGMDRILGTSTVDGHAVGFSAISTGFPGTENDPYGISGKFNTLVNEDGTGCLNDLLREGYRLPSGPTGIPVHEVFNVLGQDNGLTIYDVWYLSGTTPDNSKALKQFTEGIFLQIG